MSDGGDDQLSEVLLDRLERLALFGHLIGETGEQITFDPVRHDRQLACLLQVVRDPSESALSAADQVVPGKISRLIQMMIVPCHVSSIHQAGEAGEKSVRCAGRGRML